MFKSLERLLGQLCILIMSLLLLIVCWQVISRYLLTDPSTISEELSRIFLMWLGVFGAAYTTSQKGHIAIDLVSGRLSPRFNKYREQLVTLLCSIFAMLLVLGGTGIALNAFQLGQTSAVLQLPYGIVYSALPLGGLLMLVFLWRDFRGAP